MLHCWFPDIVICYFNINFNKLLIESHDSTTDSKAMLVTPYSFIDFHVDNETMDDYPDIKPTTHMRDY